MQFSKKRLKHLIIEELLKHKNPSQIALDLGANESWVNTVIENYKLDISVRLPLYVVKSIDLYGVYYLFSGEEEKKIIVNNNTIQNISILTEYERYWLYLNKGFL